MAAISALLFTTTPAVTARAAAPAPVAVLADRPMAMDITSWYHPARVKPAPHPKPTHKATVRPKPTPASRSDVRRPVVTHTAHPVAALKVSTVGGFVFTFLP